MKKTLIIAAAALALAACSDQSKAERAAKKYLADQSNDGKIEIVEYGTLTDLDYTYDPTTAKQTQIKMLLNSYEDAMRDYRIGSDPTDLDFAKQFAHQADSIARLIEGVEPVKCPIKSLDVTFRASNKLGITVKDKAVIYFTPDLGKASIEPAYVIPDSIYALRDQF